MLGDSGLLLYKQKEGRALKEECINAGYVNPNVVGAAGAGLQKYNAEISKYLMARGRNVGGISSAIGVNNAQLQDNTTLIVFWNGNDFDLNGRLYKGYAPGKDFSVPLKLFTELMRYFPNHIVLVSRNNHLWGLNEGWGL